MVADTDYNELQNSGVRSAQLDELLARLTVAAPAERTTTVTEALKQLRIIFA